MKAFIILTVVYMAARLLKLWADQEPRWEPAVLPAAFIIAGLMLIL